MTMRLDIVTNDAGELVRREHARELGAGVVVAIYRLAKLAQMHDLGNQAFLRQLDQVHQLIGEYCLRSGSNVSVLFADKATFVAGQLLKGNRGAYEAAAELGALLERIGGSELHVDRAVTREELHAFAEQISVFHRTGNAAQLRLPPRIKLRPVADTARLRGIELESLTADQRMVRAYASAVVIMRRFFEDLAASRYILPRRIKRIAQSLVDLGGARSATFLGVTEARNANHDEAGRAVNTAILAVAIAREATQDRIALAQIAMAAMMHDVARPRALALATAAGAPVPGMAGPTTLSEDQEDRLAAGAAAVLTALGRVNEPSITRTVLTFESLWLRRRTWIGPVYWGARPPTLQSTIIAVARRYNDLLTPEPGLGPPTTDYAIATLAQELTDTQDRTVLRMLVSALGLLPTGTLVQLSSGEIAEVTRGARGLGDRPRVKIVADATNKTYARPRDAELAQEPGLTVARVLNIDGWRKGLEAAAQDGSGVSGSGVSGSMPSLGSSPGSVAEAMGRMITDSLEPPPAAPRLEERSDKTVFEPHRVDAHRSRAAEPTPRGHGDPGNVVSTVAQEATARGNLAATPIPHVLVYMLDHALTGSVVFEGTNLGGEGSDDTIYFVNGVPSKIRLCDTVALLGDVLVEDGSLDAGAVAGALDGAKRMGLLFGEYLVGHDLVSREALAWALEGQLLRKIAHVANLAPEIEYAFYRDVDLLDGWGGDIVVTHPLNPILASVRHWADRARVRATLNRIGKHPLTLHPDSDLSNIAVVAEEQRVLDVIREQSPPLPTLFEQNLANEEVVASLVYSLAVTRQFAFKGQKKGPMASRSAAWRSIAPGKPSLHPPTPMASGSRPAMVAPAAAAANADPPPARASSRGVQAANRGISSAHTAIASPAKLAPPSAPVRAAAPASARPSAPQVRPVIAKKAVRGSPGLPSTRMKPVERPGPGASGASSPALDARPSGPSLSAPERSSGPSMSGPEAPMSSLEPPVSSQSAKLEAMSSFRLAEGALQRNDLIAAEDHAMKAFERDPTQSDYVTLLAWIRSLGGAPQPMEEAIRTMSKVLLDDPANERALFYRGRLLVRTNRLPDALNDFNELLSANPHHREAQNELRQLKAKLGPEFGS